MKGKGAKVDKELQPLWESLKRLHYQLREQTRSKYNRVNPFIEDLFEWEEKGRYFGCKNTRIYDSATVIGNVKLGDGCWVGPFVMLDGTGGLSIGNNVDFSTGVKVFSHDTVKRALTGSKHPIEFAPVRIGNNCFIGTDAVILKGARLGDRCVVAANSLVSGRFPANTIVGGVPAKKIGMVIIKGKDVHLKYSGGK
ncbi:MAG: acyltransferase [Euryarchaeota archaeon]|nr:acyltransferase [Euryarchaeota archaeon]